MGTRYSRQGFTFQPQGEGLDPQSRGEDSHMPSHSQKSQNIKQNQYCNSFNKDFKNSPHFKKIF